MSVFLKIPTDFFLVHSFIKQRYAILKTCKFLTFVQMNILLFAIRNQNDRQDSIKDVAQIPVEKFGTQQR